MCELLYFFFNVFINFYTRLIKYICMAKKELDLILQRERHTSYQQPPFSLSLKMKQDAVLIVLELQPFLFTL